MVQEEIKIDVVVVTWSIFQYDIINTIVTWPNLQPVCSWHFYDACYWMKTIEFQVTLDLILFPLIGHTDNKPAFVYIIQATSHYLKQWWPTLVIHKYSTQAQWFRKPQHTNPLSNKKFPKCYNTLIYFDILTSAFKEFWQRLFQKLLALNEATLLKSLVTKCFLRNKFIEPH